MSGDCDRARSSASAAVPASITSNASADTQYGTDTDPGYTPYPCVAYASLIYECYGADPTETTTNCTSYHQHYYRQSYACGYAFLDYMACLSSLDCNEFEIGGQICGRQEQAFFGQCNLD